MTTDEASKEIAKILKHLPLNISRKELEALAMGQIALEDWSAQYERGYVDGEHDGYFSTSIEEGEEEKKYRENFYEINVVIDEESEGV